MRGVQIAEGYLGQVSASHNVNALFNSIDPSSVCFLQHPRIPVNIEWTSADVNRYPDMVPPNAMSYGDMVVFLHPSCLGL